jgi:DNA-binding NarL/FixJ family response regulator
MSVSTTPVHGPIRVVVVDDHPVIREGIRAIIETDDELELVGDTGDADQALRWVSDSHPHVLLTDLRMPDVDGCELARRALELDVDLRVLVLTTYDDEDDILRAIEVGACGYLLKDASRADLLRAVRMAAAGETVLAPSVVAKLAAHIRRPPPVSLSDREVEVLALVSNGLTNAAIGRQMSISEATVKTHLHHVFTKLEVDDRTAAVTRAMQLGLLT